MNILAVDTSSEAGSIVVTSNGRVLGEVRLANSLQYSERLFRSIDFLFEQIDLSLAQIGLFAAARGPGSFTGLRVGLAAVEGLAFAQGKPGVGISCLAAWAWRARAAKSMISPILDARRGEVFAALYRSDGEELIELLPPAVLQPAQWLSRLPSGSLVFCGTSVETFEEEIAAHPDWQTLRFEPYLARAIAEMALTENKEPLEPLYLRPSDAERKRSRRV